MKLKSITRNLCAASAVCLAMAAAPAQAAVTQDGVTFTVDFVDSNTFTLRIEDLLTGATGGWADVTAVGALGFKGLGTGFNVTTSTITPDGSFATNEELNASGCGGGSPAGALCFTFNPDIAATDDMLFTIDVDGTLEGSTAHVKVNFMNEAGEQIGSLLSQDVSEPGVLGLLGSGLLLLGFLRRRTVV